jgi:hypothetical protein
MKAQRFGVGAVVAGSLLLWAGVAEAQVTGNEQDKLKTPFVERSLVLPEMWVTGELDASFTHYEPGVLGAFNAGWIDIGGAFGVLDDLEVEAALISLATEDGVAFAPITALDPIDGADWGMTRLGATFRFLYTDVAEVGGRFRFLIDNNATLGFNGGVPVLIHAGGVFRLDTGLGFVGRVPTSGASASFGLVDVNTNPIGPEAGIPLRFAIQAIDELWFGVNSGFGVYDVADEDTIFLPLGASVGGTLAIDPLLLDVIGAFNFPLFAVPTGRDTGERINSELWQVGLAAKAHFGLPK